MPSGRKPPSIKDVTGASCPRRHREFAMIFIDEMRRYDHSNHYNPYKFSRPCTCGRPKMERISVFVPAGQREY